MASPLPKRNLGPPNTDGPKKIAIFPAPSYKIRKKNSRPHKINICGWGEYIPWEIRLQIQTTRLPPGC